MLIASSSSSKGMIDSTGPKTSSRAIRIWLLTSAKIVGSTNQPEASSATSGRLPPSRHSAPPSRAISMYCSTLSRCGWVVMGPTWVVSSIGSPRRAVRARATTLSVTSWYRLRCTSRREPAMQVCPEAAKMPEMAPFTACSILASAKTMLGDLPPSSRVTCLMCLAAWA
ncbi:hypothetical protein D9M68_744560 [compost metagenome]